MLWRAVGNASLEVSPLPGSCLHPITQPRLLVSVLNRLRGPVHLQSSLWDCLRPLGQTFHSLTSPSAQSFPYSLLFLIVPQ